MIEPFEKAIWKILLVAHFVVIFLFWWFSSATLLNQGWPATFISVGRLSGLMAVAVVLLQFVFIGRFPLLERVFGLDKLIRHHHRVGRWSIFLIVAHPILLLIGYSQLAKVNVFEQTIIFITQYQHVWLAVIGLVLFCTVVITALNVVRHRLRYESWYFVHLLVYLAVFFSFFHQIAIGTDFLTNRFFYIYWLALYILVLGSHIIFRFIRPVYLFYEHSFKVSRVIRETYNTVSIYITGRDISSFKVQPGQFMFFRFLNKKLWWQAHPFSLSMMPTETEIRLSVKELGDFTKEVKNTAVNTPVIIDGPYGLFTEKVNAHNKILFIAGGIGITPIRSLLEQMVRMGKDVILLYANKSEQDIAFKQEFENIAQHFPVTIHHVLSDQPGFAGETGYIDEEKLKRLIPDIKDRDIYLCGPPPMMKVVRETFHKIGVSVHNIHYERFEL